ncbi:MBL fold metallo-hydrolase [Microbaculum marinum]|uniref:MBL fold metallo-hydrolase n=1 Tax=Microbaculum marinum TaxID=1764581 RepID=A0AAW9RJX8_9HYPH
MNVIPDAQVPGIYHRRIGDILVTALTDGYYDTPLASFNAVTEEEAAAILAENFQPAPPRVSINCFLIRSGGRTAIVDTGAGGSMGPTLGVLPRSLAALGVSEGEIDTVLLTHLHPDHSNGLTDPDGNALFASAEVVVSSADLLYRSDDAERSRFNAVQQRRYFDDARFQMAPYMDRVRDASGEVLPGVTATPLAGHTPGHTGYVVSSGNDALLIWGDTCHVPELQLPNPDVTVAFDVDSAAAARTRRRVLDWAASDRLLVAGMHLHFPGFIHVVRRNGGYQALPESWRYELAPTPGGAERTV